MPAYQNTDLQDLTKCTVAIENQDTGKVLGTGVIITEDGIIITCYHVLEKLINKTNGVSVHISVAAN